MPGYTSGKRAGLIRTTLEGNCPVVEESLCLDLIEELENHQSDRLQQALAATVEELPAPGYNGSIPPHSEIQPLE